MIKIFDEILNYSEIGATYTMCINSNYRFGHEGSDWTHINNSRMVSYIKLTDTELILFDKLKKLIEDEIVSENEGVKIHDSYINYYTSETQTAIHTDDHKDTSYTVLYFANPEWHPNYGGELIFYNEDLSEAIETVTFKPGRLVIFNSKIPHCAKQPSRSAPYPRFTIAFKMEKIDNMTGDTLPL